MIAENRTRLSRWVLIVLFGVASLTIAGIGYWFYHQQTHAIRATALNDLKAIAELKITQIAAWRNERLSDAFIFSTGLIRTNSLEMLSAPNDAIFKTAVLNRFEQVRQIRGYQNMILASPDGRLLLSLDPNLLELEDEEKELVARTVSAREPVFGDLFRCPMCNNIHLDVAAPILDVRQRPVGVVILRTDPEKTLYPLIQSWPLPSRSAETVLVRREGDTVLFLNVLRHRSDPALTISYPLTKTDIPAVQAVLGKTGEFDGLDYRGMEVLAEIRPVPDSPWFMVSKVDMDELLAMARDHSRMILFIIALGVFLTGVMAVYYYTYRQQNLYQRLFQAERDQRESQEEIRATLYGIGDGVIATDSKGCVRRMNPVAESLTGWTETEALGRPLTEIFCIINEETRSEVENPADRVLRDGLVVGLANHSLLIAKGGTERPIANSGAPIHYADGNITGVVLVFRDQSEERAAQKALRDSEHRFHSAMDHMIEGCQIIGYDWRYIYINNACELHSRRPKEELLGKKFMDMWPDIETTEMLRAIRRCMEERITTRMENEFTFLDGGKGWFDLNIQPVPEGVLILSTDITERKRAEEVLRSSEERWRSYVENAPYGVFITDEKGKYLQTNPQACRVTGYDESELLSMSIKDIVAPESLKEAMAGFSELAHTGQIHAEYVYLTKTGEQRWWSVDAVKLSDTRFLGFTSDITERKHAEEMITASEMKYRRLFEAARDGILILDTESGNILDVNPFLVELLGYTRERFLGKKLWEIGLFKDIAQSKAAFHDLQNRGYIRYENLPLKTADGQYRDVEFVSNMYPVGDRNVFQCNIRDITTRKIAENTIKGLLTIVQEEKERLSIVINSIPDEVWFADTNKNFILANQAAQREFCLDSADEIGVEALTKSMDVFRMDGSPRPIEEAASLRALAGEIVTNQEEIVRTPLSGELRYRQVNATPVRDADGTIIGAVSVVHDITARRQAEEALRTLFLHQQTLLSTIPDIVTETDFHKVYTWVNKAGTEFFGEDVIGKEASFYFVGVQDTYRIVQPMFDGEIDMVYVESLQRRKDGEERVLAWWCTALKDSQNNITGSLSTAHDITDRKRAEEMHDKLQTRLLQSQKLEAIGTLAGGIAHDFNNILAAIIGYSELAIPEAPEGSQIRSDLEKIFQAGNRARDVVNQILTFSRQREEGKTPLYIAPIVKEVLKLLHATLPSTVSIVTTVESKTGMVLAEPSQIHQLVMNLCTNAAHAMKTRVGTLTVQLNEVTLEDTDLDPLCFSNNDTSLETITLHVLCLHFPDFEHPL